MSRRTLFIAFILLIALFSGSVSHAQQSTPTPDPSARITAPLDGAPVFGTVTISGTAANPQFQNYRLDYLSVNEVGAQWQPISRLINQQIRDGVLGQWDTTQVKDGTYQIRLRVILRTATVLESYVKDIRVQNQTPTALPTLPLPPSATPVPTEGETATPLIQQPPSATPRPATAITLSTPTSRGIPPTLPNLALPTAAPTILDTQATVISGAAVWNSVCSGAIIAFVGFGLLGIVTFIRARLRGR